MYIIEIAVFNIKKELSILTYWTNIPCEIGDMVEIFINKRLGSGVIIEKRDLNNNKSEIRKSDLQFRKINKILKKGFINYELLYSLKDIANKHCLSITQILETFLNNQSIDILSNIDIQQNKNNLIIYYPTISVLNQAYRDLSELLKRLSIKNTNIKIYRNHSKTKKSEKDLFLNNLKEINNSIILSLPSLLPAIVCGNRPIIIANSESRYYENINGLNNKSLLIDIYKSLNKEIILTDNIMSIDTFYKLQNGELEIYNEVIEEEMNQSIHNKLKIIDRKEEKKIAEDNNTPQEYLFSDKILDYFDKKIKNNESFIIWTLRAGDWTTSVCRDCGEIIKCPSCEARLVYYENNKYFYCVKENKKYKIEEGKLFRCSYCNSWRIDMLGITTQSIYKYLNKRYNEINIHISDNDTDKTDKQKIDKYKLWQNDTKLKSSVLICNSAMMDILDTQYKSDINKVDIIIASIDSLFYINDYIIDEEIYKLIFKLSRFANNIYIQSREYKNKDNNILHLIANNKIEYILNNMLEKRLNNNFPPISYMLTFESKYDNIELIEEIKNCVNYKIKIGFLYKYIIFIEKERWDNDEDFRKIIVYNYFQYRLSIK